MFNSGMMKNLLDNLFDNKLGIGSNDSQQVFDKTKSRNVINKENYAKNKVSICKHKGDRRRELKALRLALNKELEILLEQISNKSLIQHKG